VWDSHPAVQAVAIRGNHFLAVGTLAEVRKAARPSARMIDLHGRTVLPGLEDSHTHPITSALAEQDGPIPVLKSIPEIQKYIRNRVDSLPPNRIILIPKVYSSRLDEHRYPTRQELDAAAPDRAALTANGKIIKDKNGEPTGLIIGAPQLLKPLRTSKTATHDDMVWALKAMQKAYNAVGITSVIDRSEHPEGFRVYQELREKSELTVRSYVTYLMTGQGTPADVRKEIESIPFVTGMGDDWYRIGSLKVVADGGILLGTAYLREPYGEHTELYGYHDPGYQGVLSVPAENLVEMAKTADELGWQMT